jgi:25S rRNA (uracil2843-N3)-methyltransferase
MGKYDRKEKSQPKHGKPSSSGASKAPPPLTRGYPGWNGPTYVHKKKKKPQQPTAAPASAEPPRLDHVLPVELERLMLDVFRTTFPACNDFEALKPTLQEIKDALFRRDFDMAFGRPDFLEAYAIRWSPSRALGYAQLMAWICEERADDPCIRRLVGCDDGDDDDDDDDERGPAKVVCFGGGAAEIMAFSGLLRHLQPSGAAGRPELRSSSSEDVSGDLQALSIGQDGSSTTVLLDLHLIDTADWSSVLSKLHACLETPPTLSKYASAAARASNASFLSPGAVRHTLTRADVLGCSKEDLGAAIGPNPALLTLLFTLNELYTASMPRTTSFLLRLTEAAPQGSLLLVVDSPGSYSEAAVGSVKEGEEKKRYPMSWLMDYALLPKPKKKATGDEGEQEEEPAPAWEKVISEDSVWYRLEEDLEYPVSLENMRFQIHVFKRV